jgi:hypothetical protein
MAGTTPFTIGADAICTDGACGKLTCVVVDPVAQAVTHLVVERHGHERLVPLDLADDARGEIQIRCIQKTELCRRQLSERSAACLRGRATRPGPGRTDARPGQ